jgi:HEAT repeat protein
VFKSAASPWTVALLVLGAAACGEPASQDAPAPIVGDALPADVAAMIFGSATPCIEDATCPSGICTYGSCIGVLLADARWMHARAADRLVERVEAQPKVRPLVTDQLAQVATNKQADAAYRSRALRALESLGEKAAIRPLLSDPQPRLADEAALALARLGDDAGLESVIALSIDERPTLATEALRALGHVPGDASLEALLVSLNADLEPPVLRAAIDGLRTLEDPRAIRPLVALLPSVPGALRHRVIDTLRALAKDRAGGNAKGWSEWVLGHDPPAAPEVEPRSPNAQIEEGLPAPY